jgi:TonB family protein
MGATIGHPPARFSGIRRRIPRYPVAVPLDVTVLRSGVPASIPGRCLDLGEGGVAAVLAGELLPGEWVAVAFQLPNEGQPLQTKAVVRHHGQMRCGLEFLGLSRDQRYMIRHWAGTAQPEWSQRESLTISFPPANLPAEVPEPGPERSNRALLDQNPALRRLFGLTLAVFLAVLAVAAWQWHRGWQRLEARTVRKDAHIRQPAARVSAEVMERLLVRRVEPPYPDAARRAKLQGVVVLDAVVAADGGVVNLYPVRGPDGLVFAAMDAARWWRFRPYRINGEPATVETTLAVEFRPPGAMAN